MVCACIFQCIIILSKCFFFKFHIDGQLVVIFHSGETRLLYNGEKCDGGTKCDPYMQIVLDGEVEYESH